MSKKNNKDNQALEQLDQIPPGEMLRRARREKGLAAEEVILNLGITKNVLSALEKDDYEHLPAPLYVKGYMRRYCSILGIPDDEVLANFDSLIQAKDDQQVETKIRLMGEPAKKFGLWKLVAALVLVLLAVLLFWMVKSDGSELSFFESQPPTSIALKQHERLTLTPPLPIKSQNNEMQVDGEDSYIDEGSSTADDKAATPEPQRLQIKVIQQSWVEVLDARGDLLIADLKPSGSMVDIIGMPPFDVVLGYAPGVELNYAGQQVPVNSVSTDNTVKLKVGDES
jgi:cytoskeleton protein RodZ